MRPCMMGRGAGFDYREFYRALAGMRGCPSRTFTYAKTYATARRRTVRGKLLSM